VRKTRARAASAGWPGVGLAIALALCACSGRALIPLGGTPPDPSTRYLSPTGDDGDDGSLDHPWKTFRRALPRLQPGWTLRLLNGTYEPATTGTLNVRCGDAAPSSTVAEPTIAMNGTPGRPITVMSDSEHFGFIRGDGRVPPVSIESCHDWAVVSLRAEAQNVDDGAADPDTGSVVVLDGANANVTLRRLLLRLPNFYKGSRLVRIGDGATAVTVEECELYDFHHNGIEAWRSRALVIARNYLNSRGANDLPDSTYHSDDANRGDYGVLFEETSGVYALNNIVADVSIGVAVVGRTATVTTSPDPDANRANVLRGNIVDGPSSIGFNLDSRCAGQSPCDPAHVLRDTELSNDVALGGATGVFDAGSVGTKMSGLTIIDAARGIALQRDPKNKAIAQLSSTVANSFIGGFQSVAFFVSTDWGSGFGCDHCAAQGGYDPTLAFEPDNVANVTKVSVPPNPLGTCLVRVPADSPLAHAGSLGADIGANVVYQYGDDGVLTTTPLWQPFPCGNAVPAVNTDPSTSCTGLATRLRATTPNCSSP
jgi:hypothetical protein